MVCANVLLVYDLDINFINSLVVNWNDTVDVTGSQLHDIVWGSIRRLHEIGLNVICVVADGANQTDGS